MMTNGRRRGGFDAALADAARSASGSIEPTARVRGSADWVGSAASSAGERASGVYQDAAAAGGSFLAFCREHPLVLGGIGVALGALLGAALPASETEHPATGGEVRKASATETSVVPAAPAELVES